MHYPTLVRRIELCGCSARQAVILTNNFETRCAQVAQLYKKPWQVELFFKWIKQNLRIKAFVGNSANAVKTQIWIAICTYVLVAIIKKRLHLAASLHTILQVLSLSLFDRIPIYDLLLGTADIDDEAAQIKQIPLENISGQ